jgi:hypothetical protein
LGVLVKLTDQAVAIRFTGFDRWCALSSGIVLPTWRVLGARVLSRSAAVAACPARGLPGLGWPRVLRAGCYGIGQDRQLWLVHRAGSVLAIYLRGEPYHRVVVEVAQPDDLSRDINNAIGHGAVPESTQRLLGRQTSWSKQDFGDGGRPRRYG